jgi:hypothetical protein
MPVDINRASTGSALPAELSTEIIAKTVENSIIMRKGRQVSVTGKGLTIPVITGEPTAAWVNETDRKPISRHTLTRKNLSPKTIAVIEPFSNQFRRDLPGLYAELVRRLPLAIAKKFDNDVIYGDRSVVDSLWADAAAVGANANRSVLDTSGTYQDVLDGVTNVVNAGYDPTDLVLSPGGELILAGAYTAGPLSFGKGRTGSLVDGAVTSRNVAQTGLDADGSGAGTTHFNVLGIVGDFNQLLWGAVNQIDIAISDQATLYVDGGANDINLWQQNMFAVRAEIDLGAVIGDVKAFNLFGTTPA